MSARATFLAAGLSVLAGFVDATGFQMLGGYFVSFMSGNTTKLAVGLAGATKPAAIAAALIAALVVGAIAGELARRSAKQRKAAAVLGVVALALAIAAILGSSGRSSAAAVLVALAMGAANDALHGEGDVHLGVTYVTGALVKFGQHLVAALMGGPRWGWSPYLFLWLGLALGAIAGALAYPRLGMGNLWLATAASLVFAVFARGLA